MSYLKFIPLCALALFSTTSKAQLKIDAEIRPRFEFRNGFKTLFPDNVNPAAFVSQRSRLTTSYGAEKVKVYMTLQDVRTWGDVSQLNSADNNGMMLQQAWADVGIAKKWSAKVGRQEIVLDDQRIFGSVNWAQQARSHDAAILKYSADSFKVDLGFAYNQDGGALSGNTYTVPKNYKALQYFWLHKDWKKVSGSFLILNNGTQFTDTSVFANHTIQYSQTVGGRLQYKSGKLSLATNLYYQLGKDAAKNNINAYLIGLDAGYQFSKKVNLGIGGEVQSGNENGAVADDKNNAFSPFYGTNHKFNGLMDYFYVGNHGNNVGLVDVYLNSKVALAKKSKLVLAVHHFSTAAKLPVNSQAALGTELDIVFVQKLAKSAILKVGYSQMFASDGMEELKGNSDGNNNVWAWAMLVVKPTIFSQVK